MKAADKFKLSRELNSLVAQVNSGAIKGMEKFKASRRVNDIVALLGGGIAATQAAVPEISVDLSPFERIVQNNEITLETLQGAVTSTKMLLNSATVPPIFLDAVKVVSAKVESGALLDSLGADGAVLIGQLAHLMLDSVKGEIPGPEWFNQLVNGSKVVQLPDALAQAAATSPLHEGETQTQEQLIANDYKTAKVNIAGMDIAIENPIGSTRKGTDKNGQDWETTMTAHYGYFENTLGADGDELDVFIAPNTPHDYDGKVFIMNQLDERGDFDEHKVILGVNSNNEAQQLYQAHYDEKFSGIGQIIELSLEQFKARIFTGQTALFDSMRGMMLDSWAADGKFDLLPVSKLDQSKLSPSLKEAKATIREPIVVFQVRGKYFVVHGRNRLDIASSHAEKYVPAIVFDSAEDYSMGDIEKAIRRCGNIVHAEALGGMIEICAGQRLEADLV